MDTDVLMPGSQALFQAAGGLTGLWLMKGLKCLEEIVGVRELGGRTCSV